MANPILAGLLLSVSQSENSIHQMPTQRNMRIRTSLESLNRARSLERLLPWPGIWCK